MTSRERVRAALRREPADRVPIFMWFHPETTRRLASLLEVPEASVGFVLGNDVVQTWVNNNYAMEGIVHETEGERHTDEWGIVWQKRGAFNQIIRSPLAGAEPSEMARYRFPERAAPRLVDRLAPLLAAHPDHFAGCDVSPCVFEMYYRLRGMEEAILDLALLPGETRTMLDACAGFAVALAERSVARYRLDWLWTGDDVASQRGMLMSPTAWRESIAPGLARVVRVGKEAGLPVAYHCCGAVSAIIGDLVAMGVDVLNPVQVGCPGMDPAALKREYGASLTFMGGLDTQDLLPHASAAGVRRETERLVATMSSDGGGYILAASHTVPPETPVDNIFALYAAVGLTREEILDTAASFRSRRTYPEAGSSTSSPCSARR